MNCITHEALIDLGFELITSNSAGYDGIAYRNGNFVIAFTDIDEEWTVSYEGDHLTTVTNISQLSYFIENV